MICKQIPHKKIKCSFGFFTQSSRYSQTINITDYTLRPQSLYRVLHIILDILSCVGCGRIAQGIILSCALHGRIARTEGSTAE